MLKTVHLVGAGPGDPELLTLKAHRVICQAQVLVYDRLVQREVVEMAPEYCCKIYVGKRKHLHAMPQEQINKTLIEQARKGLRVVRLKGGDPLIFGRGGEEKLALDAAGIACEIVPGITAAAGAAASASLPLTHRNVAPAVTFITAHRVAGSMQVDWQLVNNAGQTVVFYMASSVAHELVTEMIAHGCDPHRQLTIVAHATLASQSEHHTTLGDFLAAPMVVPAPAILMVHDLPMEFVKSQVAVPSVANALQRVS